MEISSLGAESIITSICKRTECRGTKMESFIRPYGFFDGDYNTVIGTESVLPLRRQAYRLTEQNLSRGLRGGVWVFDMEGKNEEFTSSDGFSASYHAHMAINSILEINALEGMSYPGIESFEGITYGIRKNNNDERTFVFVVFKNEVKLIALTNKMPFSAFKNKTGKAFNVKSEFFLMFKGALLKEDNYIELSREVRIMMIVPCMPLEVHVHFSKRMNETLTVSLKILNTDSVKEVKEKLITEYKFLLLGINETKSLALVSVLEKKLLDEENVPLLVLCKKRYSSLPASYDSDDSDDSLSSHPAIEVQLHLLPPGHICVYINARKLHGIRGTSQLLFIDSNDSTCKLREKIAPVLHTRPESLELYVNNKKIPEIKCLLDCQLIQDKCQIYVERRPKIKIVIELGKTDKNFTLKVHKLLKISSLKNLISESRDIPTFQQEIYLKNELLRNDNTLQDYKIENDDTLVLAVYGERIEIQAYIHTSVRVESGYQNNWYYIKLDDIQNIKCKDLLHSMAQQLGLPWKRLFLILNHRCLHEEEEIGSLRICDGSTVLITLNKNAPIVGENGIKIIYHSRPDGEFEAGLALFCDGIPFYPPSGILLADFLKVINKDASMTKVEKNVPPCSKGICVSENSMHEQQTYSKCVLRQIKLRKRSGQPKTFSKSELPQKITKKGMDESGKKQSSSEILKANTNAATCSNTEANIQSISFTSNVVKRNPEHKILKEISQVETSNSKHHKNTTTNECEISTLETDSNITIKKEESVSADTITAETISTETNISTKQETTTEVIQKCNTEVSNSRFDNSKQLQLVQVADSVTKYQYGKDNILKDIPSDDLSIQSISDTDTSERSKVLRRTRRESMLIQQGARVYKRDFTLEDTMVSDQDTSDVVSGTELDLVTGCFGESFEGGNYDEFDKILHKLSQKVGKDWKNLARHLELPNEYVEATEDKCRHYGIQEMCYDSLIRWKKMNGKSINLKQLVVALREMQRGDLLDILPQAENSDQTD